MIKKAIHESNEEEQKDKSTGDGLKSKYKHYSDNLEK